MKKVYIFAISMLFVSSSMLICSISKEKTLENSTLNPKDEDSKTTYYSEEDEYDLLIAEAETLDVMPKEIEFPTPSKFETIVRKLGVTFFLKPYIYIVTKYRATKEVVSKYAQLLWNKIAREKQASSGEKA